MKKQYIIAALLLLGFGVISTMAFTIETPTAQKLPKVYDFDTSQTSATITKVRVTPFLNKDAIRIKVDLATLTDDNYYIPVSYTHLTLPTN